MPVLRTKTSRMWLPDALRGLALLNMLAYHGMYDWVYVFGHESSWYNIWAPGCHVWQQYICWSFILLSGFSFPLAKRPAKNGLRGCTDLCDRGVHAVGGDLVRRSALERCRRAADLPGLSAFAAPARGRGPDGVCGAVCADEPAARRVFGLRELAALCGACGAVQDELVLAGSPGSDAVRIGGLLPDPSVGVPVLVRGVSGTAVAPRQGRAARRAASSVCHRAQYAAGLHAASARNLRCAVGVAHGAGVKVPKYEQYKNFHFSENCC